MQPLERIVLHAIPLKSLLEWLSKTRGPNLVEATACGAPEKALVLAVTKWMLYEQDRRPWEWGSCISLTKFQQSPFAVPSYI